MARQLLIFLCIGAAAGSALATEWVADFTSAPPESWTGSDSSSVATYADTSGQNPNTFFLEYEGGDEPLPGWLTQGERGGVPTTARFYSSGQGTIFTRKRFATLLPVSMDAVGGVSVAWTARYGNYQMGRAPVQICLTDNGVNEGSASNEEYNCFIRVNYGTIVTILNNSGNPYSDPASLTIPSVADGNYHQWSCSVIRDSSAHMAHWKLWVDGTLLLFSGLSGAHTYNGEQYSFKLGSDPFDNAPYVGLGDLETAFPYDIDFEFDCVAYRDDGVGMLTCGEAPTCDSAVTPAGTQTSVAPRNGAATPASLTYTVVSSGSSNVNYTVIESDDQGNPQDHAWLSLDKAGGGPIPPTGSDDITATITDTTMPAGTYTGYITITDQCSPATVYIRQIDLTIIGCQGGVLPAGEIHRSGVEGSTDPVPGVVWTVTNTGQDGLTYTVSKVEDCPWLSLDKPGGGPLAYGQSDDVTATLDATGLEGGQHVCTVRFTDSCGVVFDRPVVLWVLTRWDARQQFEAEFVSFTGTDAAAVSPLQSCNPDITVPDDRKFHKTYDSTSGLTGFLTQGMIGSDLTTAKFWNPAGDGKRGRFRFTSFLPWDDSYQPTKGVIVAWRMKVAGYSLIRGPIQISAPKVTGPFLGDVATENEFNCYIRLDNGRTVYILNNSGGAILPALDISNDGARSFADEWHQWTAAAVYDGSDTTYWNLWVDGEKLYFSGVNGSVTGPGEGVYSFRTGKDGVTGIPYVGLGDLGDADQWDFEFDWVRMISLDTNVVPFWDGRGCVAAPRCQTPFADADVDGDVDQLDFAEFQLCVTGSDPAAGLFKQRECGCFDRDGDEDVDVSDLVLFAACGSGPDVPWQSSTGCP